MRPHRTIIDDAQGATAVAEKLHVLPGYERWETARILANTVQGWKRSDSIPPEYWQDFVDLRLASLEELAGYARQRRLKRSPAMAEAHAP